MGTRRKAREFSLQILYQIEVSGEGHRGILDQFFKENEVVPELRDFAVQMVEGTLRNLKEIDSLIESHSTNWKLSRMACVDRNLLRQSVYELLYLPEIPVSVSINEAVEIAKKFGTLESSSFINGVLDKIAKLSKK